MSKISINLKNFIKAVLDLMRKPVMSVLPGQLSFFLLLSLIPILLIISLIIPLLSVPLKSIIDFVNIGFPADTASLIIPLIEEKTYSYSTIFLIISAILLVSKGTRSIISVASIIYGVESKNTIRTIIKSIFMSILLILLISFIIIIPVYSSEILIQINKFNLFYIVSDNLLLIYKIIKWPISIFIIYINIKIIYTISPNKKICAKSVNKGAIFTTIMWTILTFCYSFYINNFSSYNIYYGGASKIIVLLLWIYFISYIFVLGMSINANITKD